MGDGTLEYGAEVTDVAPPMRNLLPTVADPSIPIETIDLTAEVSLWNRLTPAELAPAPVAPPVDRRKAKVSKYVDRITNGFIEEMGTRDELMMALRVSQSPKAVRLLQLLANPKSARFSLARLARRAGLDHLEVANIFRHRYASAAMMNYFKALPKMAEDVAKDSFSYRAVCPDCGGSGSLKPGEDEIRDEIQCFRCGGEGVISKPGDSDARKLMAEATGQIKGKSGINVSVSNVHIGVESVLDELDATTIDITGAP